MMKNIVFHFSAFLVLIFGDSERRVFVVLEHDAMKREPQDISNIKPKPKPDETPPDMKKRRESAHGFMTGILGSSPRSHG